MEAFAITDDAALGLTRIRADTIRAFDFLRRELGDIDIFVNPAKKISLPPKGYASTTEEISLLESIDVRIAGEGGPTVVGVPMAKEGRRWWVSRSARTNTCWTEQLR